MTKSSPPTTTPSAPSSEGELPIADTFALECQIDEMVYALYGLTLEAIAIVEGKSSQPQLEKDKLK